MAGICKRARKGHSYCTKQFHLSDETKMQLFGLNSKRFIYMEETRHCSSPALYQANSEAWWWVGLCDTAKMSQLNAENFISVSQCSTFSVHSVKRCSYKSNTYILKCRADKLKSNLITFLLLFSTFAQKFSLQSQNVKLKCINCSTPFNYSWNQINIGGNVHEFRNVCWFLTQISWYTTNGLALLYSRRAKDNY